MRFLFVYETYAVQVRSLLAELLISDVEVILVRKNSVEPNDVELELLQGHPGAEAAACEINRKYRKNVEGLVTFTIAPKKFRFEDQLLRQWLLDDVEPEAAAPAPLKSFERARAAESRLVFHPNALEVVDELDASRWAFAEKSAKLLEVLAKGDSLGPFRSWEGEHGVAFAANGRVRYAYSWEAGGKRGERESEWHLKAGDKTSRDKAARIYFISEEIEGKVLVLVAYAGPHPQDGLHRVDFGTIKLEADDV